MAEDNAPERFETDAPEPVNADRPLWQRIVKWIGIAILSVVLLVALIVFGINTDPGRRFVADQLGGYTTASGLNIKVGRIDGSLYGAMTLSDVRVADPKGVFLTSPKLVVDWRPLAFINSHVDVRRLSTELVTMERKPELKPTPSDPNAPLLPDLDIDVNALHVGRLVLEAPVSGQKRVARIDGQVHIADRRAQIVADAATLRAAGIAGGDTLMLRLDALPQANTLDIRAKVNAPADGVIAAMAGLKKPLAISVDGRGNWSSWNGKAIATLGGGTLADLNLQARNGRFRVRGSTKPGLYLEGPVERLTAPQLDVAIDTTLNERRADTRIKLKSDALIVDAGGLIDLANNQFKDFAIDAQLLTPGVIAPNLNGRDVAARVVLDGAFATPTVDYKVRAAALGFDTTVVQQLYAEGLATINSDRILVPVKARARRVTGLNAAVGGLVENLSVDGDFAIKAPNILSDNLRIRSDKINATAVVVANIATGRYTGALKGRVNNYRVDGIGIINLTTDANLVATPAGYGMKGRVVAQTQQIFNDGARNFLGGNAVIRASIAYSPEGIVTFDALRMNAPKFQITRGQGRFDPKTGAVLVSADANSQQYGPLSVRVTGSSTNPVVVLRAPRPGVGVGLVDLNARIVGRNGAYAVTASGGTNYGPFTADVVVATGKQLAIDVRRVRLCRVQRDRAYRPDRCRAVCGGLAGVRPGFERNRSTRRPRRQSKSEHPGQGLQRKNTRRARLYDRTRDHRRKPGALPRRAAGCRRCAARRHTVRVSCHRQGASQSRLSWWPGVGAGCSQRIERNTVQCGAECAAQPSRVSRRAEGCRERHQFQNCQSGENNHCRRRICASADAYRLRQGFVAAGRKVRRCD